MISRFIGLIAWTMALGLCVVPDPASAQSNPLDRLLNDQTQVPGGQTPTSADKEAYRALPDNASIQTLRGFLQAYPDSSHAADVRGRIARIEADQAQQQEQRADADRVARCDQRWPSLSQSCTAADIEAFVTVCEGSQFISAAERRLAGIQIGIYCAAPKDDTTADQDPAPKPDPVITKPDPAPLPTITVRAENRTYYVRNQAANMRAGPGTEHPVVDTVPRGTRIDSNGVTSNNWIRFKRLGRDAYISAKVLQTQPVNQDTTPTRTAGELCRNQGSALSNVDLRNRIVGTVMTGYNQRGQWTETLSGVGGYPRSTTFRRSGKSFPGVYDIQGARICFSYGTLSEWDCKTIHRCNSSEGIYVIVDREGKQTSVITNTR